MDCEHALNLISAQLDGELPASDRPALDVHLASCESCRAAARALRQQDAALRQALAPYREVASVVAGRTIAQLRPVAPPSVIRLPWVPMILAAAAGFLLAVAIFRPWSPSDRLVTSGRASTPPRIDSQNGKPISTERASGRIDVASSKVPPSHDTKTQLVFAKGAIEMLAPGDEAWRPLATGGTIDPATRVRTDGSGRCEFRTPDGSEIRLNGNTELVFHSNRQLELARGQVWSSVAEAAEPYQIDVPQAKAKVTALGTQFDLASSLLATVLTVVQGTTRVEGMGSPVDIHFGEQAKIVGGAIAQRNRVYDLVVATSWVHEILMLKGHDNAELAKRMDEMLAQIGNVKMRFMVEKEILQLGDHCVLPLTRFIQSEGSKQDRQKRANAARILAKIARPWSVEDLIGLLADSDREVRFHAANALERLTDGQTHGLTPDQWRDAASDKRAAALQQWRAWWGEHKELFPTAPFSIDAMAKDSSDESQPKRTKS
jgi:ferric-dicitrate binding protein FerR (iron transport regulator)